MIGHNGRNGPLRNRGGGKKVRDKRVASGSKIILTFFGNRNSTSILPFKGEMGIEEALVAN